jgi:hypothetical protein
MRLSAQSVGLRVSAAIRGVLTTALPDTVAAACGIPVEQPPTTPRREHQGRRRRPRDLCRPATSGVSAGDRGTTANETGGFPSLPCGGLVAGLSGAPWVVGATITGIIGWLHGGGCDESVSYSPPFDDSVAQLLARAEVGGSSDDAPVVFDDDCD